MTFRLIPRAELPECWERISKMLAPAVAMGNGELEVSDIYDLAMEGRMHVFSDGKFAITCEFLHYPRKTVMLLGFGGGKVTNHELIAATLTSIGKLMNATSVQTYCKNPAMVRYYRRWFQLEPVYTVLEKQL